MTGRSINAQQSQGFLSTMHTMIDDLDSISSAIDDNTYLRLVNGLQRLYTIHNSLNQSPSSVIENTVQRHNERYRENFQDNNELQIAMVLAQHYDLINDISGNPIYDINTINSDANTNTNPIINTALNNYNNDDNNDDNNNNNNNNNDSLTQAQFRENARISNAYDYWNQVVPRVNVIAR